MNNQIVMEAGFKIIPGKEAEFLAMQNTMVPVGATQPGFLAVYGGPILGSSWLYFGVRFETAEQMDAWHHHKQHQAVQRQAYAKWWTAVYIRKWVTPTPDRAADREVLCETRLVAPSALGADSLECVRGTLAELAGAGALRFETLSGEFEPQPYQFVGPMDIHPAVSGTAYSIITHWPDKAAADTWLQSPGYQVLASLGALVSEVFVAWPEAGARDHLRGDHMQREWTLKLAAD